ncbi:MAG: type VI secretion system lipoprotein TssJ [Planctomycetes bacterium]|nr:type VI secretion system lipoprotein TssJ [Planctomycetota bacterium]
MVIARSLHTCAAFLALVILLTGCSRTATLQVRGVAPLNLNDAGESTPVDVRIYQLKDDGAFKRATFEKLWTEDEKVLGQDRLAAPRVESIIPGNATDQPKRIALGELEVGTRFIGIMALYAKTDARDARILVLPINDAEDPVIEFSGYGISLAGEDKKPAADTTSDKPAAKSKGK